MPDFQPLQIVKRFSRSEIDYTAAAAQLADQKLCNSTSERPYKDFLKSVRRCKNVEPFDLLVGHANALSAVGRWALAVQVFSSAARGLGRLGAPLQLSVCRLNWANALHRLNKYADAVALYDLAMRYFSTERMDHDVALCLMNRANAFDAMGHAVQAVRDFKRSREMFHAMNDRRRTALCDMNLASVLDQGGDWGSAGKLLRAAAGEFRVQRDWLLHAKCRIALAGVLAKLGNSRLARRESRLAEATLVRRGNPDDLASLQQIRGGALLSAGDTRDAIVDFRMALEFFERHGMNFDAAGCRLDLAVALNDAGSHEDALACLEPAIKYYEANTLEGSLGLGLLHRGEALSSLRREDEALAAYDAAEGCLRASAAESRLATCLMNRANMLRLARHPDLRQIESDYREAKRIYEKLKLPVKAALCQLNMAMLWSAQDPRTRSALTRGMKTFVDHGAMGEANRTRLALADLHRLSGRIPEALSVLARMRKKDLGPELNYRVRFALVQCLDNAGPNERRGHRWKKRVRATFAEARGFRSQINANSGFGVANIQATDTVPKLTAKAVRLLCEAGDRNGAWEWVQDEKSVWLDPAAAERQARAVAAVPGPMTTVWRASRGRVESKLYHDGSAPPGTAQKYVDAFRTMVTAYSKGNRADSTRDFRSYTEIAAAMPPGSVIVDFHVSDKQARSFVIAAGSKILREVALDLAGLVRLKQSIGERIDGLQAEGYSARACAIEWDRLRFSADALGTLWSALIEPLMPVIGGPDVREVYLVPHNLLHQLPVHAARDPRSGRCLFEMKDVAYLPSAASFTSIGPARLPIRGRCKMLSVVNPEAQSDENGLPGSDWEGRVVRRSLRLGSNHRLVRGSRATFGRSTDWADCHVVHFACHGISVNGLALMSHLRLAKQLLLAHDVLFVCPPVPRGAVVVLNACASAVSDTRSIDQSFGLPATFLARGAGMVLSTMCPVSDQTSAVIAAEFLKVLVGTGGSPAEALRRAVGRVRSLGEGELDQLMRGRGHPVATSDRERGRPGARPDTPAHPDVPAGHPRCWAPFALIGRMS